MIETFVELMLKNSSYKKLPELLNEYTKNYEGFINMANAIYGNLNDGRIKCWHTKCKKKDSVYTESSTEGEEV